MRCPLEKIRKTACLGMSPTLGPPAIKSPKTSPRPTSKSASPWTSSPCPPARTSPCPSPRTSPCPSVEHCLLASFSLSKEKDPSHPAIKLFLILPCPLVSSFFINISNNTCSSVSSFDKHFKQPKHLPHNTDWVAQLWWRMCETQLGANWTLSSTWYNDP